ncbi:calcium-dependent phosphoinositide phospholipase C [Prauserella shujinwangii]|uniref:Calcium-dependent phosphoinositide phospholipase C n=1 Tax=Prauserella shujinwangii TaxID=1453103 RepID=A0A2T0M127_9PSEU|nr:phosphatidylinositol-specific phospholipase C domain-containing protein [Prauserella shujinwangii]PRX50304.1 calcium-dependent phosphoinositide phospholipase C [Prauserella shujinwangii]
MRLFSRVLGTATAIVLFGGTVVAADPVRVSGTTTVGVHNTYERGAYTYLAQALDAGAALIELDVWPNIITREWKVSHGDPLGNDNNCVVADSPDDLYTGTRNKNLEHCLDDIRVWLDAHPGSGPILLKLEMKTGFANNRGLGPDELDSVLRDRLGDAVFRPADLLGGHSTLDAAARADNWPSRESLRGKVIVEAIPGTVEERNPTDTLRTDVEIAQRLRSLHAAGRLAEAQVFPAVHNAASGDPRTRYADAGLRPWFVVFDGDAATYVEHVDTAWYDDNHYLLVMTDAHAVAPGIDARTPTEAEALRRVAELAAAHASVVTSDWTGLPNVLSQVLPRG